MAVTIETISYPAMSLTGPDTDHDGYNDNEQGALGLDRPSVRYLPSVVINIETTRLGGWPASELTPSAFLAIPASFPVTGWPAGTAVDLGGARLDVLVTGAGFNGTSRFRITNHVNRVIPRSLAVTLGLVS